MSDVDKHVAWPADRFYWALLNTSTLPRANGNLNQRLGYMFENVLPSLAIEEVHAVYQRVSEHPQTYLACGIPISCLQKDISPETLSLSPQDLPEFVREHVGSVDQVRLVNLLTAQFEPKPIVKARQRWTMVVIVGLLLIASVFVVGMERRVRAVAHQTAALENERDSLIREVLMSPSESPPLHLQLVAELRRLEQTRDQTILDPASENCAFILADFLALWPNHVHVESQSISISSSAITFRGKVLSMADAQALADAFAPLEGWHVKQPQSELQRDHVAVTLRLERRQEEKSS